MNKRYLSCILFILMIILSGTTLATKDNESAKLTIVDSSLYKNNVTVYLNKIYTSNQVKGIVIETQNKQQAIGTTTLKQGDKGNKVKEIQQKLNKFGYKLYVDGDFGSTTYNAVIDFQMKNNLLKDGIVGNLTLRKLDMPIAPGTMYKPPVTQISIPKVIVSKVEVEKLINSKNIASLTSYFIWIDLPQQKVNVFNGSNKKWNLVKSMVCSSGKTSTPTVKGNFTVGSKGGYFIADGGARCKYYTQISGNYLFHSVLYDNKGNYIIDNTLGVPVSHGCVRLSLENAKFIYDNIPAETTIWSN
ncbi:L,D-transpeptidase family protein [Clostridium estertheticum]|uniref:L,D-transpeptidase family protein n=1 Tax=Clostridium estertheticum TaxID=238834 RepID=UPI0013E915C8|nr:L,D-transpeptidase family protein [Clostridium estertheticum]MBZ9687855.1 L,D-transpeptidase family protein [Clostridium estertheticum]